MQNRKYRLTKDLANEKTWELGNEVLKAGTICEVEWWGEGSIKGNTIMYDGKAICDEDSQMAQDYFELIKES